ncbi:MAG: 50S ribosomal protein L17 [Candidatus Levybacteria bacterium RIFCSPLOWO2_01_FULL_38_21]|nr:MAG: 50S ribosomal protein L17 [Candidatus Levybacteria bacterium RIFCSPLOWO2_01_FULL_38_21]
MKKNVFGRRFKRDIKERKALFKSLMSSLVLKERIKTTEAKAKAIKGNIDKLITKVKKGEDNARRFLTKSLSPDALEKLISEVTPRFKNRQGGYTRIIKLPKRVSDHAPIVLMEWVEGVSADRLPHVAQDARQSKIGVKGSKPTSLNERRLRKSDKTSSNKPRRRSALSQVGRRSSQKRKKKENK